MFKQPQNFEPCRLPLHGEHGLDGLDADRCSTLDNLALVVTMQLLIN